MGQLAPLFNYIVTMVQNISGIDLSLKRRDPYAQREKSAFLW